MPKVWMNWQSATMAMHVLFASSSVMEEQFVNAVSHQELESCIKLMNHAFHVLVGM